MARKKEWRDYTGYRRSRVCKARRGEIIIWDTSQGAPMSMSKAGLRWCVQHVPAGRGKKTQMYCRTLATAETMLRSLVEGEDMWGFWEDPPASSKTKNTKKTVGKEKHNVSETGEPPEGGAPPAPVTLQGLTMALRDGFPEAEITKMFSALLEATKPIYANNQGNVTVAANEPDWAIRKDALKLMLSYREGTPVQRKEEVRRIETNETEFMRRIAKNPNYRHALRRFIESFDLQAKAGPIINSPSQDEDTSGQ